MIAMRQRFEIDGRTLSLLALVLSLAPGCITEPDTMDDDATNTVVQIVSMEAQQVTSEGVGETVSDLFSDVCAGEVFLTGCGVFNDNGVVTMIAFPKDRTQFASLGGVNSIQFERYRVTYVRADGRNVAGVDVPYPFDGVANFLLPADGVTEVERPFIVVRHQAKSESPLREIAGNLAARLSVIAQIDFYGRDGAGRAIKVTGYLNITFSDFADPA